VPHEDRHKIFEWSNRMIGSEDPEYQVSDEEIFQAQVEMFMYAQQLAEERRATPRDVITALLSSEVDGESLSDMDFNLFFLLLSVAGNETTRNAISHGMNAFLENPDQYKLLADDVEGRIGAATEEILRWATPVLYFRRNVTKDTVIGDQEIKAGDKVTLWYISGNRDEDVFDDPFRFDIERSPNNHIAFGGWRPALLPGCAAGPHGDPRAVRGAGQAGGARRGPRPARPPAQQLHRRHQAPTRPLPRAVMSAGAVALARLRRAPASCSDGLRPAHRGLGGAAAPRASQGEGRSAPSRSPGASRR
jgi:hypothetical protein